MASHDSGSFESSFTRTRSHIQAHSLHPRAIVNRHSLQLFSPKHSDEPQQPPNHQPPRIVLNASSAPPKAVKGPVKKGMSSHKTKASKRPGTILRMVPAITACATAPFPNVLEQDHANMANEEILSSIGRVSITSDGQPSIRTLPQYNLTHSRTHSSSATTLASIKAATEMKLFSSSSTIVTYKHGKIQWEHTDKNSTDFRSQAPSPSPSSSSGKRRRPTIQVVIPNNRDRPLPATPFFGHANNNFNHVSNNPIRSASAEIETLHDVSPPSGSKESHVRDFMVSPLSAQQRPLATHFHPSIDAEIYESDTRAIQRNIPSLSNSSDNSPEDDASSTYSARSSVTSAETGTPPPHTKPMNFHQRSASAAFSIISPSAAGIFNEEARASPKSEAADGETGPRVASPSPPPRRYASHPPIEDDCEFKPTCALRPPRMSSTNLCRRSSVRRSSTRSSRHTNLPTNPPMGVINQAISRSESRNFSSNIPSPTLSEAENDLEQHLTSFTDDDPFKWDDLVPRNDPATVYLSNPPPALPRKSSKRDSRLVPDNFRLSSVPCNHIASQLKRSRSLGKNKGLTISIPTSERMTDDFDLSPIPIPPKAPRRSITPDVAENVILTILRNLEGLDDLFTTAIVNRGFYRVYKRHELDLMKAALRNMSPPAWEHREICYPGHDQHDPEDLENELPRQDYTPTGYLQYYTRDMYIIAALKSLIKDKCASFMRPEISLALTSNEPSDMHRVDDALWRIWTFCKIFGCGKGREEDIVAQMDWLKGGVLVHQKTCTFSILTPELIDMNDTLASAPECFAKGNEGGLTAEQLFDMMELWNCLGVLLQPFEGRTIQAREYGIYENTDIRGGDIDGEEMMLDEWYYYLLTLGLSPVLELASPCRQSDARAFILASQNGWVDWKPPVVGGTRKNFLKQAASRVYEDKIAIQYAESSTKEVQRQLSKQRIQNHITELRQRKNSGEKLLDVGMSEERPMSDWESVISNITKPRTAPLSDLVSHIPSLRSAASTFTLAQQLTTSVSQLPAAGTPPLLTRPLSPPTRTVAQPLLPTPPPSTVPSVADWDHRNSMAPSMPSIDEHPAFRNRPEDIPAVPAPESHRTFAQHLRQMSAHSTTESNPSVGSHSALQQHPLQQGINQTDSSMNVLDKAMYRIVEMGFTPEQARQALRLTDYGDGLSVDLAVEFLLRQM